jgi:DNA polymerase-3 subunit alpha
MYINTHSYYSFKYGVFSIKDLLEQAREKGCNSLALTDINSTAGCLNFIRMAPGYKLKPVLGVDFRNGAEQLFVGLAKNNEGFRELNAYLSKYLTQEETPIPKRAPEFKKVFVIYPFNDLPEGKLAHNEYVGVRPEDLNRLRFSPLMKNKRRLVALQTVSFRNEKDFELHCLLRAIDQNTLLNKLRKTDVGSDRELFLTPSELKKAYQGFEFIPENTEKLLQKCKIEFEFGEDKPHKNIRQYTGSEEEDYKLIRRLCTEGLKYRYKNPGRKILDRMEKELEMIRQKGFVAYFLVNWDIVNYARGRGYYYVGRGSGANSIVAYLLRITDVDPVELDLYFERFINLYRKNPPDFDIDFSWKDREDITEYIFNRFGKTGNVALLATYTTFQHKAAIRELGKVFGLPPHEIDELWWKISNGRLSDLDEKQFKTAYYGEKLIDFPNHLSIHAGGILISEKPIHEYTATFLPPKGFPTTHFDMHVSEDAGLSNFYILSQRGLGKM